MYNNQLRRQELESELTNTRSEIRDYKQRTHELNNRINELQRQMQDSQVNKNRNEDRIRDLEKVIFNKINNFWQFFSRLLPKKWAKVN